MAESLTLYRQLGDPMGMIYMLLNQGTIAIAAEDATQVTALGEEALRLAWASDFMTMVGYSIGLLAAAPIMQGDAERGVRLFGAAIQMFESIGLKMGPFEQAVTDRLLQIARDTLGQTHFAAAWAAGRALSREAAVADALRLPLSERSSLRLLVQES